MVTGGIIFFCSYDKISCQRNLAEKGFILPHRSRLQFIGVGKSRQPDLETSVHTKSAVRRGEQ